jgi:hypothetical protein
MTKKLIVTANLKGLPEANFVQKITGMVQAAQANPTVVSNLTPTAAVVLTKIQGFQGLLVTRDNLRKQQKQNTELILAAETDITNIITSQWAPQVQQAIAGDASKAKLLGFGVKGEDSGHTDNVVTKAAESHPIISRVDMNIHLQHTLHVVNSQSGHTKLPDDAKQIDIYEQIGGTAPADIKLMQHIGIVKKGKFINHFEAADMGKTVFYMAVYIDKKTLKPLELSPVVSAQVV